MLSSPLGIGDTLFRRWADDDDPPPPNKCGKQAIKIVHWPTGSKLPCCEEHYRKAIAIANTLGFTVVLEPVTDKTLTCTQDLKN